MKFPKLLSRFPDKPDGDFIGPIEFITNLHGSLGSQHGEGRIHVLHGPSGIGKTRMALEYAHRYASQYKFMGWLVADKRLNTQIKFALFAQELELRQARELDVKLAVRAVKNWLAEHSHWLLIFDGADDIRKTRSFLPSKHQGHIVVTANAGLKDAINFRVPALTDDQSFDLLLAKSRVNQDEDSARLIDAVKGLPLSVSLAGSYLRETGKSTSTYLDELRNIASTPSVQIPIADSGLEATLIASIQQVQRSSLPAADLLGLCAFLSHYEIPLGLIQQSMPHLPDALAEAAISFASFDETVSVLERLSLIERFGDTASIHPNTQIAVRSELGIDDRKIYAEIAVLILRDAISFDDGKIVADWSTLNLLPHAFAAAKHAVELKVGYEAVTSLLNRAGMCLEASGQFREAEWANKQSLRLARLVYGPEHPALSPIYKNLGDVAKKQNDLAKAKEHYDRALAIAEAAYGSANPVIATINSNIGEVLHQAGRIGDAQEYFQRALAVDETVYGKDHPNVVPRLRRMGSVFEELDELPKARESYERMLQILQSTKRAESEEAKTAQASLDNLIERIGRLATSKTRDENSIEITQKFLAEIGASTRKETEQLLIINSLRGRLKSFAPLPVLVTTTNPTRQDVLDLFQYSLQFATTNVKRAGVFIYREPPDVFVQMQIAEARVRDGFIIIPIPLAAIEQALLDTGTPSGIFAHYCNHYLPGVDFFDARNAIGDSLSFFGRSELLHVIEADLVQAQAVGLFGLRKAGKTSVLLQLGLGLRSHPVLHIDLQPYGGNQHFGVELFHDVVRRLSSLLGDRFDSSSRQLIKPHGSYATAADMSPDFVHAVSAISEKLETASFEPPILIFLDEVERILPRANDSKERAEEFNAFFGALRALSQQLRKVGILVADVHPDCNRINHWEQEGLPTNPVNQFFKELFLKPFSKEETFSMMVNIGRLMGRSFDGETLSSIHEQSGGHPFVARQLGSLLTSKLGEKKNSQIRWTDAHQYVAQPFIYSGVLKDYFQQNIWEDMRIRGLNSSMDILRSLACKENIQEYTRERDLFACLEEYKMSHLVDSVLWLESVGLLDCMEESSDRYYRMRLPLLSRFIQMQMTQKEIRRWRM